MLVARLRPVVTLFFCAALSVSGCATNALGPGGVRADIKARDAAIQELSDAGLSRSERELLERNKKYAEWRISFTQGGAALGAAAGAGLGVAAAKQADLGAGGMIIAGLAGAVIGGVAGAQIGYEASSWISRKNEAAEVRQGDLESAILAAEGSIDDAKASVRNARDIAKAEERRIADLNRRYDRGRVSVDAYQLEVAKLQTRVDLVNHAVVNARADLAELDKAGGESPELAAKANDLRLEIAKLENQYNALLATTGDVPPEVLVATS